MPFRIGLSGLNAAQADLKVTGNNIANVGTIGFKQSRAEFADVFASSKFGSASTAIGSGVSLAATAQQFTQGNIIFTENNLDLGITGDGFFTMDDVSGNRVYTRNGQFKVDREGFIVDNSGSNLKGYGIDPSTNIINTGDIVDLQIISTNIEPSPTSTAELIANIDAGGTIPTIPFSVSADGTVDPNSYNHTTSFTSFDSLGNPMLTSMFFRKEGANTWNVGIKQVDANGNVFQNMDEIAAGASFGSGEVEAALNTTGVSATVAANIAAAYSSAYTASRNVVVPPDIATANADAIAAAVAASPDPATAAIVTGSSPAALASATNAEGTVTGAPVDSISFLNNGTIDPSTVGTGNGVLNFSFDLAAPANPVMTGASITQSIATDLNFLTQYGADFGVTNLTQNGSSSGQLSGIDVDESGIITARFTNGQSNNLGQVFLTNFTNNQGLSQLGDNYWGETFASGQGIRNEPGSGNAGLINSGALEDSNVDLTAQLINLITAQRNFQANAKTITTADTITQTLIQI